MPGEILKVYHARMYAYWMNTVNCMDNPHCKISRCFHLLLFQQTVKKLPKLQRAMVQMCPSCGLIIWQLTHRAHQFDTIKYTLSKLESAGESYDCVAILQLPCPLRSREDIENFLHTMNAIDADTVITVKSAYGGLLKTLYHRHEDGASESLDDNDDRQGRSGSNIGRSSSGPGGVYLVKAKTILEDNALYGKKLGSVVMPPERCFDVDEPFDWSLLQIMGNSQ